MPERHSTGDSGSSSSGGSWSSSSSGSSYHSSSSGSSYHSYNNNNREPQTPEQQALSIVVGIIAGIILLGMWCSSSVKQSNSNQRLGVSSADATRTTQAITESDLRQMNAALKDRIPIWQRTTTDQEMHSVNPSDSGFGTDPNTKEVDYGYCAKDQFYVYVLEKSRPEGYHFVNGRYLTPDTEGYVYLIGSRNPKACIPARWQVASAEDVGGGWFFVTLVTELAPTEKPLPTQVPAVTPDDF